MVITESGAQVSEIADMGAGALDDFLIRFQECVQFLGNRLDLGGEPALPAACLRRWWMAVRARRMRSSGRRPKRT
ncbi:MAG: hypothetical protein R3D02_13785 [Hyphomicrobiales bacterium]